MLRPFLPALACVLIANGCALIEPPPPAGTVPIQLTVANHYGRPVELVVTAGNGPIPGAVQPSTVPPVTSGQVRFFVPITGQWTIVVNNQDLILASDMRGRTGVVNDIGIDIDTQGNTSWWCNGRCP